MPSDYIPIDSSDSHLCKKNKGLTVLAVLVSLMKMFVIASIIISVSLIAAAVIHGIFPSANGNISSPKILPTLKSLQVRSLNGSFRPPIGGKLICGPRVLVPSTTSPIDANQVRPADIKYIAGMGDSYMTGYLSFTNSSESERADKLNFSDNAVGNNFAMGGNDRMESHVTLANILRHLNPNLIGYSTGRGLDEAVTGLNVAAPGMWLDDLQRQARELIRRLGKYSVQSIKDDWKLVHIFTGMRDISGFCMGQGGTNKQEYKRNLTETIEILQNALPKTIISIIGVANYDSFWTVDRTIGQANQARVGFKMAGACKIADSDILLQRRIEEYREANIEIVSEIQTKSRKDHVVIVQHIFDDLWGPLRKADGTFNTDFYAADFFHLSNYGNSLIAKQLWHQLMSPDSSKIANNAMMSDEKEELTCPEHRCPFIRTPSNSIYCVMSEENVIDGAL